MGILRKNKSILIKIGVFVVCVLLYILLQRLYNFVHMFPYYSMPFGNEINDAAYYDLISGNRLLVVLHVIIFVQWALLGMLFYFLSLKEKAMFHFLWAWFILFLCLAIVYSLGTWGYYLNLLGGSVGSSFLGLFADESHFLYYMVPALSGFFLMQSFFKTEKR